MKNIAAGPRHDGGLYLELAAGLPFSFVAVGAK